jgi:ABC-type transport system involved in cytochrome c biogenesis permease component
MRWLLIKDLQILRRSPLLCGLLVLYPIGIALMIGAALSRPPGKPTVAFYDAVPAGRGTIAIGSQHLDIAGYASELLGSVRPLRAASAAGAVADVRSGRALAAVIIPADLPGQIQSLITQGAGHPTVRVIVNTRNPLERRFVADALAAREASVESDVSRQILTATVADLQRVLDGGSVALLGQTVQLLGLRNSKTIIDGTIASLPARSPLRIALGQVSSFAATAIAGLGFAEPVLGQIGAPLTIDETDLAGASTPTDAYAAAIAVVVSLMFVAMLLAAGLLALERSEHTWGRLVPGLVSPERVLAEKALIAGALAALVGVVLAACVAAFVTLDWERFELWVVAIALGGVAFAGLGVAIGAVARELSAASLMAFLVSLPVAFVALVPAGSVNGVVGAVLDVVAFVSPFRATLSATQNAFAATPPGIGLPLVHLAVLAVVYLAIARVAVVAQRFV